MLSRAQFKAVTVRDAKNPPKVQPPREWGKNCSSAHPGVAVLISNLHCIHFFFEISFLISIFDAIWTIANFKSISKSRWEFWMKFQIEISNCKLLQILNLKLIISFIVQKGPNWNLKWVQHCKFQIANFCKLWELAV